MVRIHLDVILTLNTIFFFCFLSVQRFCLPRDVKSGIIIISGQPGEDLKCILKPGHVN